MKDLRNILLKRFGKGILRKSSLLSAEWYGNMIKLMGDMRFNTIIEIGTFKGVSSVFFSQYCSRLVTIDLLDPRFDNKPLELWDKLNINNIEYHVIRDDIEKIRLIENIKFDFAYIDGDHGKAALIDWLLVKKCGKVMFHDYGGEHCDDIFSHKYCPIKPLVDTLPQNEIQIKGVNALWVKKELDYGNK